MFLGAFFYLMSMDWRLAIIIVVMIPLFVLISKVYVRQMRRLTREVRDSDSKVSAWSYSLSDGAVRKYDLPLAALGYL